MSERRFLWEQAITVAYEIRNSFQPFCVRIEIAGSLRRQRPDVGDIEILYIPVLRERPDDQDMFRTVMVNLVDEQIREMECAGILSRRQNALGREAFGQKNKLMVHHPSEIPVDLFAATEANWWNLLVCRTGPAELNTRICVAAQRKGWKWTTYGSGFQRFDVFRKGFEVHRSESERDVFEFVGLPYLEPEKRE